MQPHTPCSARPFLRSGIGGGVFVVPLLIAGGLLAAAPGSAQTFVPGGGSLEEFRGIPGVTLSATGFGDALAVGDGEVFVGEGETSLRAGSVYIYRPNAAGEWEEAVTLTIDGEEPGDGFGSAISLDGERLLVSAPYQNEGRGAVHLFRKGDDGEWTHSGRFAPEGIGAGEGFGYAALLAGSRAFVGAPGAADRAGALLVYEEDETGNWEQVARLTGGVSQSGDLFGAAMALREDLLVVGAPGREEQAGIVYAFRHGGTDGGWEPAGEFRPSEVDRNHLFGSALTFLDQVVLVGTPGYDSAYGAIFAFREGEGSGWLDVGRLVAFDGSRPDGFGTAVAVNDGEVWAGSPRAMRFRGAAYVLQQQDGMWTGVRRIMAGTPVDRELFGTTLAVRGDVAAIGKAGADNEAGTVAIFERGGDGLWREAAVVASPPESLPALVGETITCGEDGKADIFSCQNVEILGFLPITDIGGTRGVRLNDIWGWTDPETGREYALVGRTDGSAFVDITDPNNPFYVGEVMRTEGSPAAIWRDIKVYENHAYIVADASGNHGMQVFDLTRLREFDGEPITWDPDLTYDRIASAHNVVINEETGFAYAVGSSGGGETCGGGLHMIDIRNPKEPTFAGCFSDPETGRASTGYSHDAQCVIYRGPDERYQGQEICLGANETALAIADVTDKENPVAISRAGYPNVGYSHQGWLTEDHRYFYMNDELDELMGLVDRTRTIIWDVTRLDDPQVVGEYFAPVPASDHNLYIVGDLMYQSNYASGLRIIDISDPLEPEEIGYLDTAPFDEPEPGFEGSWSNYPFFQSGTIAVSGIGEGLFLLRFAPDATVF